MKLLILVLMSGITLPVFAGKESASRFLFQVFEKSGAKIMVIDGIRTFKPVQIHCTKNYHVNETICEAIINGKSVNLKKPNAIIAALEQVDVNPDPAMGTVHWYTGGFICSQTIATDTYRCVAMENVD